MNSNTNHKDEKELLRSLLFEQEIQTIQKLQQEIASLKNLTQNDTLFLERLEKHLDAALQDGLNERRAIFETLSKKLPEMIADRSRHAPDALGDALQATLSPAIAKGIAQNKEKMIDALYPIMGGMITKYVTHAIAEMMETINRKLDEGLSWRRYKRKLIAKLKGVKEEELLVRESIAPKLTALFVIHKQSGLLVAHAQTQEGEVDEPHLVASMASAIKDFINDWIAKQQISQTKAVELVSYGDATLYIESAGSVYLIGLFNGYPNHAQKNTLHQFFASIIKAHTVFFATFDGDSDAAEAKTLAWKLKEYLASHTPQEMPQKHPPHPSAKKRTKWILGVLIVAIVCWWGYQLYQSYQLHLIEEKIEQQAALPITFKQTHSGYQVDAYIPSLQAYERLHFALVDILGDNNYVDRTILGAKAVNDSFRRFDATLKQQEIYTKKHIDAIKQTLHTYTQKVQIHQNELNQSIVQSDQKIDRVIDQIASLSAQISQLTKKHEELALRYDHLRKQNTKVLLLTLIPKQLHTILQEAFEGKDYYDKQTQALDFRNYTLFDAGSLQLKSDIKPLIIKAFQRYLESHLKILPHPSFIKQITIEGYSDTQGSYRQNKKLSQKRAQKVSQLLSELDIMQQYNLASKLHPVGMGEKDPVFRNGVENKEASRRIRIRLYIDHEKIRREIESALKNDT